MSSIDGRRARRFGLGALAVLAVIGGWLWWRKHHPGAAVTVSGAGALVATASLVWPASVLALRRGWMFFAQAIGRVNALVLLTVIFFVLLTPVAIVRRLFRRRVGPGWKRYEPRARDHFERPY